MPIIIVVGGFRYLLFLPGFIFLVKKRFESNFLKPKPDVKTSQEMAVFL